MDEFAHPRVVVGVDGSLPSLAALRAAVAEARRHGFPLHAVRAGLPSADRADAGMITTMFLDALGAIPDDIEIHQTATLYSVTDALCASATDPRDLIVVGTSGKGAWHAFWSGSVCRGLMRRALCPILVVPAPKWPVHCARHTVGAAQVGKTCGSGSTWKFPNCAASSGSRADTGLLSRHPGRDRSRAARDQRPCPSRHRQAMVEMRGRAESVRPTSPHRSLWRIP